ncbi:MAG: hypothetical protein EX267_12730 [Acidimicrobiia bacterium]|nr:hypothetical protein [Phycisphaerae bacterium]NNF43623.1 hypothetical protein [Phycisphaerales bacterium]RZV39718.1 MAG: hypothetical protein EX267_12730 [Acidimicrobiia bacterium]
MPRAPRTTDDRDRPCAVGGLSRRQLGLRALGLSAFYDRHTRGEVAATQTLEVAVAIAGGVVGLFLWKILEPAVGLGWIGVIAGYVLVAPAVATLAWLVALGPIRRRRFRRITDVYLAAGRCPSCTYELAGLTPENDACLVCPECGAAWRSERISPDAGEPPAVAGH